VQKDQMKSDLEVIATKLKNWTKSNLAARSQEALVAIEEIAKSNQVLQHVIMNAYDCH
jgi:hypothetical protein